MKIESVSSIETLLEREFAALSSGRLGDLADFAAQKESAAEWLAGQGGNRADTLSRLRALSARNEAMLKAARQGVSAALSRIKGLQNPNRQLTTYDKSGTAITLQPAQSGGLVKRS